MNQKTFNEEMKSIFGGKVWRLSLSSAVTCPNRDGHVSTGGCIFCSEGGSGEFASSALLPIEEQLRQAKAMVAAKRSQSFAGYMAYFQSFTSTYAPLPRLREMFFGAAADPEVLALSIATRPDCLSEEVLALLTELHQIRPVWVELGLQTASDETARIINRGYDRSVFEEAVHSLNERGIRVVVHTIIGLPGEDRETILDTYRYLKDFSMHDPIDAVKLQQLCILRGTHLAGGLIRGADGQLFWRAGNTHKKEQELLPLPEYTLESYTALLKEILAILPENISIHRLAANPPGGLLIAPSWCNNKKKLINSLRML